MEAIILAGGKGSRLQSVVSDVPKPMALINNIPFLTYILQSLDSNGVSRVILSIGFKVSIIRDTFRDKYNTMVLDYCDEEKPLGTGGAIAKALEKCHHDSVIVINGDTYFGIDLSKLMTFHGANNADVTIALKEMRDSSRYGSVDFSNKRVTGFREKASNESGFINGGIYSLRTSIFEDFNHSKVFSFEKDFLTKNINRLRVYALPFQGNFIDIGIPEDYLEAQTLIPEWVKF